MILFIVIVVAWIVGLAFFVSQLTPTDCDLTTKRRTVIQ